MHLLNQPVVDTLILPSSAASYSSEIVGLLRTHPQVIVGELDPSTAATFFTELFGLPKAKEFGPFLAVELNHGVSLDYAQVGEGEEIRPQHYAFLVSEDEFDAIYGRIRERGMQHWADPRGSRPGEINHNDGGRGVYFQEDRKSVV